MVPAIGGRAKMRSERPANAGGGDACFRTKKRATT